MNLPERMTYPANPCGPNRATKVSICFDHPQRSTRMYQVDPSRLIAPGPENWFLMRLLLLVPLDINGQALVLKNYGKISGLEFSHIWVWKWAIPPQNGYSIYSDRKHDDKPLDFRVFPCFSHHFQTNHWGPLSISNSCGCRARSARRSLDPSALQMTYPISCPGRTSGMPSGKSPLCQPMCSQVETCLPLEMSRKATSHHQLVKQWLYHAVPCCTVAVEKLKLLTLTPGRVVASSHQDSPLRLTLISKWFPPEESNSGIRAVPWDLWWDPS